MEHDFFSFIYKRQLIWYKRQVLKESPPWSDDPVFQKFKIINMYRELDRCTKYIMSKVSPLASRQAQLLNIIFYRFFNADMLYEHLGIAPFEMIDAKTKKSILDGFSRMRENGERLFNPAYLISPGPATAPKHLTILHNLEEVSARAFWYIDCIENSTTPDEAFRVLLNVPLAGPFLACEFWTDLAYIHFFPQGWTDNDFVNIGPGAEWGLEILAGEKLSPAKQWAMLTRLHARQREVLPTIHTEIGAELPWEDIAYKEACSNVPFLSLTNVEGALCEFRKYYRLSRGKGRRRYFTSTKSE